MSNKLHNNQNDYFHGVFHLTLILKNIQMKKIFTLMAGLIILSFVSCGNSQKDQEKQKKIDDSIMDSQRNAALDNANKILSDTTSTLKKDSVAKVEKKK